MAKLLMSFYFVYLFLVQLLYFKSTSGFCFFFEKVTWVFSTWHVRYSEPGSPPGFPTFTVTSHGVA